jgi:hypothetical protein
MLNSTTTDEKVRSVLERVLRIPSSAREYTMDAGQAWRHHRVSAEILDLAMSHGLPTGRACGVPLFDASDVMNLAMHVPSSAAATAARRFWAAGMNRAADGERASYEIRYGLTCPEPGHAPDCRYRLTLPGSGPVERTVAADAPASALPTARVSLQSSWPILPPEVCTALDVLRDVDFVRLPRSVRTDLDFVRQARISDCLSTARLLVDEGRRRGLPVRFSRGLMVVLPFSTPHNWAEFRVAGRWVPVDPVLIRTMLGWGVLDAQEWTPNRSPGAIFCRLSSSWRPLAIHEDRPVAVTLATRRLADYEAG